MPPRVVRSIVWGERDLSPFAGSITVEDGDLAVQLVARGGDRLAQRTVGQERQMPFTELWTQPLNGETTDGWRFRALKAGTTNWSLSSGSERSEIVQVRGWDWTFASSGETSTYWVSEITAELPAYLGNLELTAGRENLSLGGSFSRGHYYLESPDCDYALVNLRREPNKWALIAAERAQTPLTHAILRRDLDALALAFGSTLASVGYFWCVDQDLRALGVLGGSLFQRAQSRKAMPEQAPVPSTNDLRALPAVFFNRFVSHIAGRTRDEAADLVLASWYYLESICETTADAAIVKMALAAAVSGRYILGGDTSLADESAFAAWRAANDVTLADLERADRALWLRAQLDKVRVASPATIVHLALAHSGLALAATHPLSVALQAAQHALAAEALPVGQFYTILPRLRTVVAALVSKAIDYKGPIAGWVKQGEYAFYEPAPQTWWPEDPSISARFYTADVSSPIPAIAKLWPRVEVPEVPTSGVLGLLARYCGGLAAATEGRAYAELQPLPLDDAEEERSFEVALRASGRPSTKITLFVARPEGESVVIEGWRKAVVLSNGAETDSFLREVAGAPETAAAIERLILASVEAARHGQS